jgi:hypothetical protein
LGTTVATCTAQTSAAAPPPAPRAADAEIDKILTRLERRQVRDLHAQLAWQQRYVVDEEADAVTKRGEIWYQDASPVARFLIQFKEKIASGRRDALDERHLFDGQWYTELQSRTRSYTRREIRKPDDPGDPYKIGQGAFPLPFGQKKEDILREFDVQRLDAAPDDPPDTDHLRLTPRTGTKTEQTYKRLDFWIDRTGQTAGLPIMVRVAKKDGTGKVNSYVTIRFTDVRLNAGFSTSVFKLDCPAGYDQTVEPLKPVPAPVQTGHQTPGA